MEEVEEPREITPEEQEPRTITPEEIIIYLRKQRGDETIAEWEQRHRLNVGTTSRWLREDRRRKIPLLTVARIGEDEGMPLCWDGQRVGRGVHEPKP